MGGAAQAGEIELRSAVQVIRISTTGGLPVSWTTCAEDCAAPNARRAVLLAPGSGGGEMRWRVPGDEDATRALAALEYDAEISDSPGDPVAVLRSQPLPDGRRLVQRYELSWSDHTLIARLAVPEEAQLVIGTGVAFVPEALPGFGAVFSDVEAVRVGDGGQQELAATGQGVTISPDAWAGIRSHFWTWLARPAERAITVTADGGVADQPRLGWQSGSGGELALQFYAGPVEWKSLRVVAGELTQMLFAALWEPLRWLSFGLFFLLGFITRWVGSHGVAIVLLSLAAKILLWPLTRVADGWQAEVNRIQARLQPRLAAIRREFRGEEAHRQTLAVYKAEGVHPLFTLKSLAGFAIQVPMFIAAFDMLADNFALSGQGFLWIDDLAKPDRWAALSVTLPFFGGHLNLLPGLMTVLTIASAMTQTDPHLTASLLRRQRRQLYLMAAAFFVLFYTFPAGMVLYWTANNAWHLLKMQALRVLHR